MAVASTRSRSVDLSDDSDIEMYSADERNDISRRDSFSTDIETNASRPGSIAEESLASNARSEAGDRRSLPPPDQGRTAWIVLAGATVLQAPVWGFSLAFGVIQEYLTNHVEFEGGTDAIASIGTSATGIMYLSSPLTFWLLTRWPQLRPWCGPVGLVMATGGFVASSFATTVWQLILLQGVVCALGSGLLFTTPTLYLDEWFVRRKGMAYGVMWAGKSLAGAALPFIVSAALERFGFRNMIRGWAVILLLVSAPLLPIMHPRIPLAAQRTARPLSWAFLRSSSFWTLQAGNVAQSLGYFLPTTYLSLYCARMGLAAFSGPLLLAVINGASTLGGIAIGMLGDRGGSVGGVGVAIGTCALGSAVAVLVLWGALGSALPALVVFAAFYGFFAGGYSTTWSGMLQALGRQDASLDTGLVFGMLAGGRGLGNVVSGPLSAALLAAPWPPAHAPDDSTTPVHGAFATEYAPLVLFTGVSALVGGCGYLERWL